MKDEQERLEDVRDAIDADPRTPGVQSAYDRDMETVRSIFDAFDVGRKGGFRRGLLIGWVGAWTISSIVTVAIWLLK